jgi:hypothetical protein
MPIEPHEKVAWLAIAAGKCLPGRLMPIVAIAQSQPCSSGEIEVNLR